MKNKVCLIAPCGMNCAICLAYMREIVKCDGCRGEDKSKMKSCVRCIIKNCDHFANTKSKFCYDCDKYPCLRLKQLDKRYRTRYKMSMIENLEFIKTEGLTKFIEKENQRWKCPTCGGTICVHRGCLHCNKN